MARKLDKFYAASTFSPEETQAIQDYTEFNFGPINSYLNAGHAEGTPYVSASAIENSVATLDNLFPGRELPMKATVYSGLSSRYKSKNFVPGETYIFRGFVSASLSNITARGVSDADGKKSENILLQIDLSSGQKAVYIDNITLKQEKELLLPRGSAIRVISGPHTLPQPTGVEDDSVILFQCEVVDEDE